MTDREALIKLTEEIQQVKDSHNEKSTSINYGTICSLIIIAHRLLEEVGKSDRERCEYRHETVTCEKCRNKRTSFCGNCKEYDEFEPITPEEMQKCKDIVKKYTPKQQPYEDIEVKKIDEWEIQGKMLNYGL